MYPQKPIVRPTIRVSNQTGRTIEVVTVAHKYSDVYKNSETFANLPNGFTTNSFIADYNTGFGTTGKDWWALTWRFQGENAVYITNPNNFRAFFDAADTVGPALFKAVGSFAGRTAGMAAGTAVEPGGGTALAGIAGATAGSLAAGAIASVLFNSETTVGFKQHILRSEDEDSDTVIIIKSQGVTFHSPSGDSDTVFTVDRAATAGNSSSVAAASGGLTGCASPVGIWRWFNGSVVAFYSNGNVSSSDHRGTWERMNDGRFHLHWDYPSDDYVSLSSSGMSMQGNFNGAIATSTRQNPC